MLKEYDLNLYSSTHVVRITLTAFNYVGHVTFEVSGNCMGKSILECGLDFLEDPGMMTENDCFFNYDEDNEVWSAVLTAPDGEQLVIEEHDYGEIEAMITAIEIVEQKEREW